MANLVWFSEEQWVVIEPFMPANQPGARRVEDRQVLSGIVHVLPPVSQEFPPGQDRRTQGRRTFAVARYGTLLHVWTPPGAQGCIACGR